MNPTNEQELRAIVGEIPNYIFECLELSDEVKEEWKHGSKASDFGSHNQFVQMFSRRIQAHTNAEIAKAKLEAFDIAFDCHDYDRLRAYRAELLKEVK